VKIDLAGLPAQIGLMLAHAAHVYAFEGGQNVAEVDRHGEVTRGSLLVADILSKSAPTFLRRAMILLSLYRPLQPGAQPPKSIA
jgi:hypothetical protein